MANTVQVSGLNAVLRSLRQFDKAASAELRDEANRIAVQLMVPHFQQAARKVPSWGMVLSDSIRAKRDRIPSVSIGYRRKAVSGGASSIQLRWPTHSGDAGASGSPFQRTSWIDHADGYQAEAMERYGDAITRVVRRWNAGGIA